MRDFWGIYIVFTWKKVHESRITKKINYTSRFTEVVPITFHAEKKSESQFTWKILGKSRIT